MAQERLDFYRKQQALITASKLYQQAGEAAAVSQLEQAINLGDQARESSKRAGEITRLSEESVQARAAAGIEDTPVEDFVAWLLTNDRPLIDRLLGRREVASVFVETEPKGLKERLITPRTEPARTVKPSAVEDRGLQQPAAPKLKRGLAPVIVARMALGLGQPLAEDFDEIVRSSNPELWDEEKGWTDPKIRNTAHDRTRNTIFRLMEVLSTPSLSKGTFDEVKTLHEEIRSHPHYGQLTIDQLRTLFYRHEGWEALVAPSAPGSDKGEPRDQADAESATERSRDKLEDLTSLQERIIIRGLDLVEDGFRHVTFEDLVKAVFNRTFQSLTDQPIIESKLAESTRAALDHIEDLIWKLAAAKQQLQQGNQVPPLLRARLMRFKNDSGYSLFKHITIAELEQILKRILDFQTVCQLALQRKHQPERRSRVTSQVAINIIDQVLGE